MRYCPSAFVVTVVEMLVLSARRTTFASATTLPDGSVTVPLTAPVAEACPNNCPQRQVNSRNESQCKSLHYSFLLQRRTTASTLHTLAIYFSDIEEYITV